MDTKIKELNRKAEDYSKELDIIKHEIQKVIVGQEEIIDKLLISLLANGHVLLEGVPGLAKTLLIRSLAETLNVKFHRIQFTPDLLPADITGTKIYDHKNSSFTTKKGPIFANFILADEINRAPPKVQSALLEAMQEKQVTISGETFFLELPFFVLATQNPLETEGTYQLPEAQVDRFMFKLLIGYPDIKEEREIIKHNTQNISFSLKKIMPADTIMKIQEFTRDIYADEKIEQYVTEIVDATRYPEKYELEINGYIDYGASPRASIWLILAAKANALLNSRGYVIPEDIQQIAYDVLRHRVLLSYEAEAEDMTSDDIIKLILNKVKVP